MRSEKSSHYLRGKLALSVRHGFTLVELLVVIAIIGILMGIAVPAIFGVIGTAKSNKQRLEIGGIEQAIERYREKYGDYPPDFSDWTIVERHYRKIFPRISYSNGAGNTQIGDLDRLRLFLAGHPLAQGAAVYPQGGVNLSSLTHDASKMDRAKAIVWALGGYSSNPINPFTGDGGPLEPLPDNAFAYQVNVDRDNALYEFDTTRMDLKINDKDAPISFGANNYYKSSDNDLFPSYAAHDDGAPFVYFDSRTYKSLGMYLSINNEAPMFNLFSGGSYGSVRPYIATGNLSDGFEFVNRDSFQLIAPGIDGRLGYSTWWNGTGETNEPNQAEYFIYPSGQRVGLENDRRFGQRWISARESPGKYQEPPNMERFGVVDHWHQDNLTNFADGKLIDELAE